MGVLHHMDVPLKGWQALVDCLKPNGVMKIGLYSELARQHIVESRKIIRELGLSPTSDNIRAFRQKVFTGELDGLDLLLQSPDFYSMSNCRDLVFHYQEYRFTIEQLQEALSQLNLSFLGFEFQTRDTFNKFDQEHGAPGARYDLNEWATFENNHPSTFHGMYQFWVMKG